MFTVWSPASTTLPELERFAIGSLNVTATASFACMKPLVEPNVVVVTRYGTGAALSDGGAALTGNRGHAPVGVSDTVNDPTEVSGGFEFLLDGGVIAMEICVEDGDDNDPLVPFEGMLLNNQVELRQAVISDGESALVSVTSTSST